MREVRMIAAALAGEFGGAVRAADEAGLIIKRVTLAEVRAAYAPPTMRRAQGAVLLAREVQGERDHYLAVALGHHLLRHRTLSLYPYGMDDAALYDAPREQQEAAVFAREFIARCRPAMNLVPFRARIPS